MELVGGGSDIIGATPSSCSVSVLLLASVERFGVSRMRDFFFGNQPIYQKPFNILNPKHCPSLLHEVPGLRVMAQTDRRPPQLID